MFETDDYDDVSSANSSEEDQMDGKLTFILILNGSSIKVHHSMKYGHSFL